GQDNHFSDPITNMNISAQGYATLNSLLNPEIAVLEGGYSIQGALPYVNLGIVLAMAGLDYSYVREPDFDPQSLQQEPRIRDYINRLTQVTLEHYFHPPQAQASREKQNNYFIRSKEVFYDTAYITERQREMLLDCDNCPGLLRIETHSSQTRNCLGLEIPRQACDSCARQGYQEFEQEKQAGKFKNIQFIDRIQDSFQRHLAK
ncbi:MAG: histone deacetylase, partial [Desulfohalobiaceae bacterium]